MKCPNEIVKVALGVTSSFTSHDKKAAFVPLLARAGKALLKHPIKHGGNLLMASSLKDPFKNSLKAVAKAPIKKL